MKRLSSGELTDVAGLFGVLAEPSRLALLQALRGGPLTVSELVELCEMKQANVSKHLARLRHQRLVKARRFGMNVRYSVADLRVFSLCEVVCGKAARDVDASAGALKSA